MSLLGYQLAQATVKADETFERSAAKTFGLRKVEFTLLCLIVHNPGVKPVQLARALSFTAPNTTSWIDKLVNKGLALRSQNESDKRAQNLHATALGERLAIQAGQNIQAAEHQSLQALPEAERLMLFELLRKVARVKTPL
ncbi:MAG: MarR family transcriptional regulator [Hydrogenophaga sp.]